MGRAHYYAAKVDIAKPTDDGPRMAYINIRLRFFETDRDEDRHWTSTFNTMWFCKTLVDDSYFRAPDGVAGKRPQWVNDRACGRVVEDAQFKPVKWNPDAKKSDKYLSKSAATRLRHGDPRRFINGVAMDINSFVK